MTTFFSDYYEWNKKMNTEDTREFLKDPRLIELRAMLTRAKSNDWIKEIQIRIDERIRSLKEVK